MTFISSCAKKCKSVNLLGQKRLSVATDGKKVTPWWNHEVKDAIQVKKVASRPGFWTKLNLLCIRGTLRHERTLFEW